MIKHWHLTFERYSTVFAKHYLKGCMVRSKGEYGFALAEKQTKYDSRVENEFIKKIFTHHSKINPNKPWLATVFTGYEDLLIALRDRGDHGYVIIDALYRYESQDGETFIGQPAIPVVHRAGGINKTKYIDGMSFAACGNRNALRLTSQGWERFSNMVPKSEKEYKVLRKLNAGFDDIDGFSRNDLYAVGGRSDVWHYDGTQWAQVAFPSNMILETVCCAGDGWVYIGGQSGSVFKGRGEQWKMISMGGLGLPFKDMVWFQDRVFATSDYGLWEIRNDKVVESDVPEEIKVCSGHLSVGDGVMLLAGIYGIAVHDGERWEVIADLLMLERQWEAQQGQEEK